MAYEGNHVVVAMLLGTPAACTLRPLAALQCLRAPAAPATATAAQKCALVVCGCRPEQWELGGGRTWTTRQPLADLCWSGASPGQGAALTQDLRLLGFAADQGQVSGGQLPLPPGPAAHLHTARVAHHTPAKWMSGDGCHCAAPLLCCWAQGLELLWHGSAYLEDLHAAPPAVGGGPGRAGSTYDRACCCWGHHPRVVVISTGRRLLSVDVRAAGGGAAVPLWACARGEGLLALAPSGQVSQ